MLSSVSRGTGGDNLGFSQREELTSLGFPFTGTGDVPMLEHGPSLTLQIREPNKKLRLAAICDRSWIHGCHLYRT